MENYLFSGQIFKKFRRVAVCQGGQAAAVWFYGSDNPYALPSELIIEKMSDQNAEKKIFAQIYGMAKDTKGRLIKTFTDANVIDEKDLPHRRQLYERILGRGQRPCPQLAAL